MNNRYLYKAKKIYKEEWVEGFYVLCRGHHYILPVYDLDHGFDERYSEWFEIEPSTLCQCTGMCGDKSSAYILDGKELNVDELIMELAERGKIFLNFDRDISKFGVEVTL